jgi:predicted MFS family arabinose efflux permease
MMPPMPGEPSERDLRLILAVQGLRAFLYGFGSVTIGAVLAAEGLTAGKVGLVFTAMLAGMALTSLAVAVWGDRFGRRRVYAALLLLMGAAGAVFGVTVWIPALVAASITGTISTDPNESGPITSMEQAMIGEAPAVARVHVFGRYNAIAYLTGAFGALAAGGPAAFRHLYPALPADQRLLLIFPAIAVVCAILAAQLSSAVEGGRREGARAARIKGTKPPRLKSGGTIRRLAALFALDSFGGGFIVQTFLVFWFQRKFGASIETLGLIFFAAGLLQAVSSVAAARLGARFGLLNTMVFTHLPSNVLLLIVPFMPTLGGAVVLLLLRFALSQMDVPTRQAYLAAVVEPEERTPAAAYTNTARYASRPFGPAVGGVLMQHVAFAAPFVAAGSLKIVYDVALYGLFRKFPLPSGPTTSSPASPPSGRPPPSARSPSSPSGRSPSSLSEQSPSSEQSTFSSSSQSPSSPSEAPASSEPGPPEPSGPATSPR